jgi:aspartate racemase
MKTIGILGGLSPESTVSYYNYITRKYYDLRGDYAYPEIIIHSFNFQEFIDADFKESGKVISAIEGLAGAGADFVVAACNSVHLVYEEVCKKISIPWVSIMDAVAERIQEEKIHKVALLGTVFTMRNDFYPKVLSKYNIETVVPKATSHKVINEIIFGELVRNVATDESRRIVSDIIEELHQNGAEGVILGCTELPFLIRPEDVSLPIFSSTAIHSQKALSLALE